MLHHVTVLPGDEIFIGPNISVHFIDARGGRVRLGFEAPPSVPIYREELYLQLHADERRPAADDARTTRTPELTT